MRRRHFAAGRLDAAQGAAKFIKLPFIGELLPLGHLDEFEHFIQLINHLLERLGNLRGVGNGLADGRSFGGPEIGGLDPLALTGGQARRRLRRTLIPAVNPAWFATRFARGRRHGSGGGHRFRFVFSGRGVFVRTETFRLIRMGFAKTAGSFSFVLGMGRRFSGFDRSGRFGANFAGFRRRRIFFSAGFGSYRARPTPTATAPTATAIATRAKCSGG